MRKREQTSGRKYEGEREGTSGRSVRKRRQTAGRTYEGRNGGHRREEGGRRQQAGGNMREERAECGSREAKFIRVKLFGIPRPFSIRFLIFLLIIGEEFHAALTYLCLECHAYRHTFVFARIVR